MSAKGNIPLTTLAARLEKAIHCDVGMQGLKTLLYGWKMKDRVICDHTFPMRVKRNGEAYLTDLEAHRFSDYCGYDLTHD